MTKPQTNTFQNTVKMKQKKKTWSVHIL